jgi:hypothetical protein
MHAVTLKFTSPGDDGLSGTAAGYDILYKVDESQNGCPGVTPDDTSWKTAERSPEMTAEPAGSTDYFNVRPLVPNTPYCIGIRARDEVPNTSDWTVISTRTLTAGPGNWSIQSSIATGAEVDGMVATNVNLVLDDDSHQPIIGWTQHSTGNVSGGNEVGFVSFDETGIPGPIETVSDQLSTWLLDIHEFRLTSTPGGGAAAVLSGRVDSDSRRGWRGDMDSFAYVLLERTNTGDPTWQAELIVQGEREAGGIDSDPSSTLTYVPNGGGWNPVVTFVRVDQLTKKAKKSTLVVAERSGGVGGMWDEIPLISRQESSGNIVAGFFQLPELATKQDDSLVFALRHCGMTIYSERNNGTWTFYNAGLAFGIPRLAFDQDDNVVLISKEGNQIKVSRQEDFVMLIGNSPNGSCETLSPQLESSPEWNSVYTVTEPDMPWSSITGAAIDDHGTLNISLNLYNDHVVENRVITRCGIETTQPYWVVNKLDRTTDITSGSAVSYQSVLAPGGNLLKAYGWGIPWGHNSFTSQTPDYVYLTRGETDGCAAPDE